MANSKPKASANDASPPTTRFEYRVWGKHKRARSILRELADTSTVEQFEDCYLLVDDPTYNVKVRDNTLKVKELVHSRKGFERWASDKYRTGDTAPSPFDRLYDELKLHKLGKKGFDLPKAVAKLGPDSGVRAMVVTKDRQRYRVGDLNAEVTDIEIHETNQVLRTLSIEGNDLAELVSLRKKLGLKGEPNTAVHHAIDPEVDTD